MREGERGNVGARVVSVMIGEKTIMRVCFCKRQGSLFWNLVCFQAMSLLTNSCNVM